MPLLPGFLNRRTIAGCAGVAALTLGLLFIWPSASPPPVANHDTAPIAPRPLPAGLDLERPLFRDPIDPDSAAPPPDAPVLAGIAGRLPDDAVAMVRGDDGRTRIVAIGQNYRGWRLESLSGDAALFIRGTQRARVALPVSADEPLEDQ